MSVISKSLDFSTVIAPLQASAVVGLGAGVLADWLMARRGWRAARVRALMQTVATLGALSCTARHTPRILTRKRPHDLVQQL